MVLKSEVWLTWSLKVNLIQLVHQSLGELSSMAAVRVVLAKEI